MPITPTEAEKAELEAMNIESIYQKIDEMLKSGDRTYSTTGLNYLARKMIIQTYGNKGWVVEVQEDPRDGDYLRFKKQHSGPQKEYGGWTRS
jgi:hypothetical protein